MGSLSVLSSHVMAGFSPAIHEFFALSETKKTWMPATSAGMTNLGKSRSLFLELFA